MSVLLLRKKKNLIGLSISLTYYDKGSLSPHKRDLMHDHHDRIVSYCPDFYNERKNRLGNLSNLSKWQRPMRVGNWVKKRRLRQPGEAVAERVGSGLAFTAFCKTLLVHISATTWNFYVTAAWPRLPTCCPEDRRSTRTVEETVQGDQE